MERKFDLEERTLRFAREVRAFLLKAGSNGIFAEDRKQLLRSSGSVGANYLEGNQALSRRDFAMRIKISRKETKESQFWLKLMNPSDPGLCDTRDKLISEANELERIFGAIVTKVATTLQNDQ